MSMVLLLRTFYALYCAVLLQILLFEVAYRSMPVCSSFSHWSFAKLIAVLAAVAVCQ
jgi:hypothetical protein